MSSATWTPRAVESSSAPARLDLWRAVEWQHIASTTRLVDHPGEQRLLEEILEESKPPARDRAGALHYLLATPFRYPPAQHGSRFRGAADPGVFYGADERRTACAELGYWRWRFLRDSEGLASIGPAPHTVFQARVRGRAVDLREKPFSRDARRWTSPTDYGPTQSFASVARRAGVRIIRYESVRDPQRGGCAAVLGEDAFSPLRPATSQKWLLTVTRESATWQRDEETYAFRWST